MEYDRANNFPKNPEDHYTGQERQPQSDTPRDSRNNGDNFAGTKQNTNQTRLKVITPIHFSVNSGEFVDQNTVKYQLYNSFNYSLITSNGNKGIKLSLGITSPNFREGKTTAACNLATAISLGTRKRTVIVDFNLSNPRIHQIFGTPKGPGLTEALTGDDIYVTPTQMKNLYTMSAGELKIVPLSSFANFRDILSSLYTEFDLVIVDLPAVNSKGFPTLIANQLNGLIVVVESGKTKRPDIRKLFRKIREQSIVGFVMNRIKENDL
jgi:protein-tyrosine kinase